MITVREMGRFQEYIPENPDEFTQALMKTRVRFTRNEQGQDFYALARTTEHGASLINVDDEGIVRAAGVAPDGMFPLDGLRLFEVDIAARPEALCGRLFDPATGSFSVPPPRPILAVSAAQAKLALYQAGLLDAVKAAVEAHPYAPVRIWYGDASTWERWNPYVLAIAEELGLSEAQVDALFAAAAKL